METPHIKQCVRFNIPGHAHELTFSCYNKKLFLSDQKACLYLAQAIGLSKIKYNYHVWAYVFMPDHVHLLIMPMSESYSISNILTSIKQSTSRKIMNEMRKYNHEKLSSFATGQKNHVYRFWEDGGGYDRNITNTATIKKVVDYIHNNPVRKGPVTAPHEWEWSSAGFWTHQIEGVIPVDKGSFHV